MDPNACDTNHLDSDSLLPPRKRLLAGLKRQNSPLNSPATPTSTHADTEFDARLYHMMRSQLSDPNVSIEEIAESSRFASIEAAKNAEFARANAEEKAAKAAKAVAAAKRALELVETLSEEAAKREKRIKKRKMKKHVVPVEELYTKNKGKNNNTDSRTDEELARNLHRTFNSSPRILKNSSGSDVKKQKNKKIKSSESLEKTDIHNGDGTVNEVEMGTDMIRVDLDTSKLDNEKVEALQSKDKLADLFDNVGKKRGRIKQKKLPLSICSFRDQTGLKEQQKVPESEDINQPLFSVGPSSNSSLMPVERTSNWKCQPFKAPTCVEQNKVMQS